LLLNLPWIVVPALIIVRMWRSEHPFTSVAQVAPTEDIEDGKETP
jgi:hypothetical protein